MVEKITISDYYKQYPRLPIIDVRSPGEFAKGHIPGAHNIPLFTNEERAHVGTVYVQESQEKAMELGYKYVDPKRQYFVDESMAIAPHQELVVHCWRGGMRSQAVAKHLHENGMVKVLLIEGGYKAFRNHVLNFFGQEFPLKILGGYTGSGKTNILKEFAKRGLQVVDLEGLANHKGSAFGAINEPDQPTVEQFENDLFKDLNALDLQQDIWMEDESQNIGRAQIPQALFLQMKKADVVFVDIPREERAKLLIEEYTHCDKALLAEGIRKITKRLGGLRTQQAFVYLDESRFFEGALLMLLYYDKAYKKGLFNRDGGEVLHLALDSTHTERNAEAIIRFLADSNVAEK